MTDVELAAALKSCILSTHVVIALLFSCRETLRRDPVVQMLYRVALRDFELSGYSVPAGKQLLLPLKYLSAHDPRWEDATGEWSPDAFAPERMLTPEGLKAGDLMPFGYGSRWVGVRCTSSQSNRTLSSLRAAERCQRQQLIHGRGFCSSADLQVTSFKGRQQGNSCREEVPPAAQLQDAFWQAEHSECV